ncbi:MAG: hypothetical protein AB7F29_18500 [Candidatus Nitrosocosmicus sp.]
MRSARGNAKKSIQPEDRVETGKRGLQKTGGDGPGARGEQVSDR